LFTKNAFLTAESKTISKRGKNKDKISVREVNFGVLWVRGVISFSEGEGWMFFGLLLGCNNYISRI
jgi:hypothetical protein